MCKNPEVYAEVSDVSSYDWYAKPVRWAVYSGVSPLSEEKTFDPERDITREEMTFMLFNYMSLTKEPEYSIPTLQGFKDADDISEDYLESFLWACEHNIVSGYSDVTLKPQNSATRAEASTIIYNYINFISK